MYTREQEGIGAMKFAEGELRVLCRLNGRFVPFSAGRRFAVRVLGECQGWDVKTEAESTTSTFWALCMAGV